MIRAKRSFIFRLISLSLSVVVLWLGWMLSAGSQSSFSLTGSEPNNQARGVEISKVLQFQFDQDLPQSIQTISITTEPETPIIFDIQEDRLLVKATEDWDYSTDYTITVPNQTELTLAQDIQLQFRSEPQYTYNRDIQPILDAHCVACHRPEGTQPVNILNSYESTLKYVVPGSEESELIDPRWTSRHANPFTIPTEGSPDSGIAPAPIEPGIPPAPIGDGPATIGGAVVRNPVIGYVNSNGYRVDELGVWTDEQIDIVTTWIVQDQAAEDIDS